MVFDLAVATLACATHFLHAIDSRIGELTGGVLKLQ